MIRRFQGIFIYSAAIILFIAAAAKLLSATGSAQALDASDSVLYLSHRHLFLLEGGLELVMSAFLLMSRNSKTQTALIAWLATNFLVYRLGLWWMGAPNLCNCLGNLDDYLPLSPRFINAVAYASLAWLLIGSWMLLMLGRRKQPMEVCPEIVVQTSKP